MKPQASEFASGVSEETPAVTAAVDGAGGVGGGDQERKRMKKIKFKLVEKVKEHIFKNEEKIDNKVECNEWESGERFSELPLLPRLMSGIKDMGYD